MKHFKRRHFLLPVLFICFLTIAAISPGKRYFEIAKNLEIFVSVFKEVNTFYVDEVDPETIIKTSIDAMLYSLDPYTNYIPEEKSEDFRVQNTGEYGGIGAITSMIQGKTKVVMLYKNFPAYRNGLLIGDEIIGINGVDISKMNREAINHLMKGQANSKVNLTLQRYGKKEPIQLYMEREKIRISCVPYFGIVDDSTGYIKLTEFTQNASKEVKNALLSLKISGAKSVILDVRNNPGGLLSEAVNITNLFLPKGVETVSTRGKIESNNNTYKTLNEPVDTDIPLAVLTNGSSASAAEIVAGVIQDYDRGLIVGQRSFGKGLVQVTRPLSYNGQLKITTAKYYTPSGRCIQALDYSHRDRFGNVASIPDSTKSAFDTKNGRIVYDGGGIEPDIKTLRSELSPFSTHLYKKGLIFDYATKFYYEHPSIVKAKEFAINDEEYVDFIQWIQDKEYDYKDEAETHLTSLKTIATQGKYLESVQENLNALEEQIKKNKNQVLLLFQEDIRHLLEREITARYYLEAGIIENTFHKDEDLREAITALNTPERYKMILGQESH